MLVKLTDLVLTRKVGDVCREQKTTCFQYQNIGAHVRELFGDDASTHARTNHDNIVFVGLVEVGFKK